MLSFFFRIFYYNCNNNFVNYFLFFILSIYFSITHQFTLYFFVFCKYSDKYSGEYPLDCIIYPADDMLPSVQVHAL